MPSCCGRLVKAAVRVTVRTAPPLCKRLACSIAGSQAACLQAWLLQQSACVLC